MTNVNEKEKIIIMQYNVLMNDLSKIVLNKEVDKHENIRKTDN